MDADEKRDVPTCDCECHANGQYERNECPDCEKPPPCGRCGGKRKVCPVCLQGPHQCSSSGEPVPCPDCETPYYHYHGLPLAKKERPDWLKKERRDTPPYHALQPDGAPPRVSAHRMELALAQMKKFEQERDACRAQMQRAAAQLWDAARWIYSGYPPNHYDHWRKETERIAKELEHE